MAEIVLSRVDSRLIHTQQAREWMQRCGAERIVVIDDGLKNDPFVFSAFQQQIPRGIRLMIVGIDQAADAYGLNAMGDGKVALFFKDIQAAYEAAERGLGMPSLQVARSEKKKYSREILPDIFITETEALLLKHMEDRGIDVYFQDETAGEKTQAGEILKKFKQNLI